MVFNRVVGLLAVDLVVGGSLENSWLVGPEVALLHQVALLVFMPPGSGMRTSRTKRCRWYFYSGITDIFKYLKISLILLQISAILLQISLNIYRYP